MSKRETVTEMSEVEEQLIEAYRSAHYRLLEPVELVLQIGEFNRTLGQLFKDRGVSSAVFITAWNPFSRVTEVIDNEKANQELKQALHDDQTCFFDGIGEDPMGLWPGEPSVLALGLSRKKAISIGKNYSQNAIVWIGSDAIPRLELLR